MSTAPLRPLVIGHRGFGARFPHNSVAGVEAALAMGADGVEVDVRLCRDGVWVCHHDRRRGGREVDAWRLDGLRREGVPTLAEVVAVLPRRRWLYVEVKPLPSQPLLDHLDALARLIDPLGTHVRVLSSSLRVLDAVAIALPRVERSWVVAALPAALPPGIAVSPKHTLVEALLPSGVALHPWTVNRASRLRKLAELGVVSLTTDRPDRAVEVLHG